MPRPERGPAAGSSRRTRWRWPSRSSGSRRWAARWSPPRTGRRARSPRSAAGSTNIVLHLLAVAREAGVELALEDFDRIAWQTPLLCDLKPGGRYVATDLYRAGGVPLVIRRLHEAGLLHGDALTVTGQTIGEVADAAEETPGQDVVRSVDQPLKPNGGFAILRGNLAPEGCVVKLSGHDRMEASGPARVFEREEEAFAA